VTRWTWCNTHETIGLWSAAPIYRRSLQSAPSTSAIYSNIAPRPTSAYLRAQFGQSTRFSPADLMNVSSQRRNLILSIQPDFGGLHGHERSRVAPGYSCVCASLFRSTYELCTCEVLITIRRGYFLYIIRKSERPTTRLSYSLPDSGSTYSQLRCDARVGSTRL